MPRPGQVIHLSVRLAVYLLALVVLATARLPDPQPSSQPALRRAAEPDATRRPADPPSASRLALIILLASGAALDLRGRRVAWR